MQLPGGTAAATNGGQSRVRKTPVRAGGTTGAHGRCHEAYGRLLTCDLSRSSVRRASGPIEPSPIVVRFRRRAGPVSARLHAAPQASDTANRAARPRTGPPHGRPAASGTGAVSRRQPPPIPGRAGPLDDDQAGTCSQATQREPSHHRCQVAPSVPRATMERRSGPHDAAAGTDAGSSDPPSDSHGCQLVPSQ